MERKQACIDEATEFLCPLCGTSAFEVIDAQWNCGDEGAAEESLTMRCLNCLEVFSHRLETPKPGRLPAEGDDGLSLVTDILGPMPDGVSDLLS